MQEILLSEETVCGIDENKGYMTVVMFTNNKKIPMVFPFLYDLKTQDKMEKEQHI